MIGWGNPNAEGDEPARWERGGAGTAGCPARDVVQYISHFNTLFIALNVKYPSRSKARAVGLVRE